MPPDTPRMDHRHGRTSLSGPAHYVNKEYIWKASGEQL